MQTHSYDTGINDSKKFLRHSSTRVKKLLDITLACSLTYKQEALILSFSDQFLERGSEKWDEDAYNAGEIKEKDPEFIMKLYANQEGTLKWIVQQSQMYFRDGFKIPESVKKGKEKYMKTCLKEENNDMNNYIKNTWVKDESGGVEMKTILEQFRNDFPEDALLSDGQIQTKILDSIKELGAVNKRKDIIIEGKRTQKMIWTVKKLGT